mmetsp:Transcript_19300/g.48290  ORF Transcript_19300/g.48290 Transcript_19300/m.48290 type:complete len:887 (-) Transcript_19300:919-3579(-)|eukprot:CAMPEP_0178986884 /NCGR_PEP_ID=MMETSP0795-20121207/2952_1 /TAXON_ID=88552 /ORGANISM="Amoebophrya sp., Strain Ameob2" /LENGTH=886 /DNA_ID=CAMNT_0020677995 /DNA_START=297 /DNA_END=2957 /DNA_ORIENTATION=+
MRRYFGALLSATAAALFVPLEATACIFKAHSAGNTGVAEQGFPWQNYYQAGDGHEHLVYRINVTNIREFAKEKQRAEENTERELSEVALGVVRDALKEVASGKNGSTTTAILTSMRTQKELLQAYRRVLAARKEHEPIPMLEDELKESANRLSEILRLPKGLLAEDISQNIENAKGTARSKFAAAVLEHVAATDSLCTYETPTTSLERDVEDAWKKATTVQIQRQRDGKAFQTQVVPGFFAAADNGEKQENEHALRKFFFRSATAAKLPTDLMDLSESDYKGFVQAWDNRYRDGHTMSRRKLTLRLEPLVEPMPENWFNELITRSLWDVTYKYRAMPDQPLHPQSLEAYRRFLEWKDSVCKDVKKDELQEAAVAVLEHATELPRKIGEFLVEQAEACAGDSRTTTTTTGCGVGDRGSDELPKLITSFRSAYLSQNEVAAATQQLAYAKKGEESVVTQYLQNTLASASLQVVTVDQGATELVKNRLETAGASPVNFKALQSIRRTELCKPKAKPSKTVEDAIKNGFHGIDITGSVKETEPEGPWSSSGGGCNVGALFASLTAQLTGENGSRFTEASPFVLRLHVLEGVGALRKQDESFYKSLRQAVKDKELLPNDVASRIQLEFGHTPRLQEPVTPEDGRGAAGVEEQPDDALRSAVELLRMPFAKKVFNVNAHSNMLLQPGYDYQKLKKKLQKVFSTPEYCETERENRCSFSIGADGAGAMGKDLADVNGMYAKYFEADAEDPADANDKLAREMEVDETASTVSGAHTDARSDGWPSISDSDSDAASSCQTYSSPPVFLGRRVQNSYIGGAIDEQDCAAPFPSGTLRALLPIDPALFCPRAISGGLVHPFAFCYRPFVKADAEADAEVDPVDVDELERSMSGLTVL